MISIYPQYANIYTNSKDSGNCTLCSLARIFAVCTHTIKVQKKPRPESWWSWSKEWPSILSWVSKIEINIKHSTCMSRLIIFFRIILNLPLMLSSSSFWNPNGLRIETAWPMSPDPTSRKQKWARRACLIWGTPVTWTVYFKPSTCVTGRRRFSFLCHVYVFLSHSVW